MAYESPTIEVLGSVAELTEAFNKVGAPADDYVADIVVGSPIPYP